ncbi:hypothetical protein NU219Hw_g4779t1 [Hortaea werneckii]
MFGRFQGMSDAIAEFAEETNTTFQNGLCEWRWQQPWASGFYGHNDMDMLEVGNDGIGTLPGNLTYEEEESYFTAWALLKSPLFIGTDLTKASKQSLEILGNCDLIKSQPRP